MSALDLHPLCTLFPRIEGAEFDALVDDIKSYGLRQPIVVHGGMILDGGNRYRACIAAGVEPRTVAFEGDSIVSFVLSANLHRRHLSAGQQAAIVASAQDWANAHVPGSNQHATRSGGATLHDHSLATVADRAAQSGASVRTQKMADKVARTDPELAKRVAHGEVSLPKAARQIADTANPAASDRGADKHGRPTANTESVSSRADITEDSSPDNDEEDFEAHLRDLHSQIDRLQRENAALGATDSGAEMTKQVQLLLNAESKLEHARARESVREKQLAWFGRQYAELRKILSVKTDRDVLSAVRRLLGLK